MTVTDSQGTSALGPTATANLLRLIAHSSDVPWLTTCLNHNVKMNNTVVVHATQQRLADLAPPTHSRVGENPIRMTAIEQALKIWPILVTRATRSISTVEAKITYGNLVVAIGYGSKNAARSIRNALDLIGRYCLKHGIPTLNSLVVNQNTCEAGDSVVLHNGLTPGEERVNVVKFDWHTVQEPTAAALVVIAENARRSSLRR
jgi:hypothetical protein